MPSGGVRFLSDAAIFPRGIDGTGPRGAMTLDLTQEQRWQAGFLRARTPGNFDQINVRPARERVSIRREGDRLQVVNGLGGRILEEVKTSVMCQNGELRAGSGFPEGTRGFAQTTQVGILSTGVPTGCPPEKDGDCFPAEKVEFKPNGH